MNLFIYKESKSEEEILNFFNEQSEQIFTVFFDRFVECETSVKKGIFI